MSSAATASVKGAPLFEQDDTADRAAVDQAERLLQQAKDQLANLQSPAKPTEIAQAEANLRDAEAARDKVAAPISNAIRRLLEDRLGDRADRRPGGGRLPLGDRQDRRRCRPRSTRRRRRSAGPARSRRRLAAVDAARAALAQARWRLDQRRVVAPAAGVVADVLARPGETLAARARRSCRCCRPKTSSSASSCPSRASRRVHVGDAVALSCDDCPPDLTAAVSYIAPQAEYTPPFIYSESTRAKFVFLAEARPTRRRRRPGSIRASRSRVQADARAPP